MRGSSPHSRGTRTLIVPEPTENGIIPAFAGNTKRLQIMTHTREDHPRIRGEHPRLLHLSCMPSGSSPHSRGTRRRNINHFGKFRIIPAFAGNTGDNIAAASNFRDHPRIRGEHYGNFSFVMELLGIIPAFAGNTNYLFSYFRYLWDHPRIRGEH